jgi:hypothetical protein
MDYEEAAQLAKIDADRRAANARVSADPAGRRGFSPNPPQRMPISPASGKSDFPYAHAGIVLGLVGILFGLSYPSKPPGIPPLPPPST